MILVTAPTGHIGSQLLDLLLRQDEQVRVIIRDPGRLPPSVAGRVQVVQGSHRDPATTDRALDGVDQVFWVVPVDNGSPGLFDAYVGFSIPAVDAIVRHRVSRVVTVSALGRGRQQHAGFVSASLAMDDLFRSTGAHLRSLTMPSFMENLLWQVGSMKAHGAFFSPISGSLALPTVATRDVAGVAAALLLDAEWTGQESHGVLGHEDLSFDEMAAILTDVLRTTIRFHRVEPGAYRDGFLERGYSPAMAQGMLDMAMAKDAGIDTDLERNAANTTPTSFRQWCEDTLALAFHA
ncbi:MAG: hypothetical protein RI885_1249 [Actinomycetota bacterium]|jgi:uncharacterized protein YbjT (DUF2867 family)